MTCAANEAEMRRLLMDAQVRKSHVSLSLPVQYAFLQICKHAFLVAAKREGRTYDSVAKIITNHKH
jgi:hypothetical protein